MPHYKRVPGPPGHFLLGSTRDIRHDPLRFGLEMARHHGDIVRIRLLFWPAYLVNHPEVFDPERFTPEQAAGRPHYAYFPFGGGPRICIGNNFALMEIQLVLATIAQHYRLRLVPGHPVEPEALLSLRPHYGLPMTLDSISI